MEDNHNPKLTETPISITITTGTLIKAGVFVCVAALVYELRSLILVLLTAVVIASVIEPGTQWFVRRRIPRVLSAILMYALIILAIVSVFTFVLPPLFTETVAALSSLPKDVKTMDILNPSNNGAYISVKTVFPSLPNTISIGDLVSTITSTVSGFSGGVFDTVAGFFGGIISFVLVVVISFYLSVREDGVGEFLEIVSPVQHEKYIRGLWRRSQGKIGRWMQGQLLLAVLVGVMAYVSLLIINIKHPLLLACVAAVFELIPVVGLTLSLIPAFLFAVIDRGFGLGLIVIAVYLFIQQIEAHVIYPLVVKKIVGIPPLLVIIALVAGAELAGFIGAILSVPISVAIMEYVNDIERKKRISLQEQIDREMNSPPSHIHHTH